MFYLLKVLSAPDLGGILEGRHQVSYGLFEVEPWKLPKPVIHPEGEGKKFYDTSTDFGRAVARYMRERFGQIDGIEATEHLEAAMLPEHFQDMDIAEGTDETVVYAYGRLEMPEYVEIINSMSKELEK